MLTRLLKRNSANQQGFALPLVTLIGLVMSVSSMMLVVRAMGQQTDQVMKETTSRALSIAELGVTRYQNFLVENPELVVYPDCVGTRNSSGACPDTGSVMSWSNASAIPDATSSTEITTAAGGGWRDVIAGDPSKGQIRLLSFSFDNDDNPATPVDLTAPGEAILEVEGRVGQSSQGQEMAGTGISRLRVAFNVIPGAAGSGTTSVPGLWITCNDDSGGSTSGTIQSNIKDSTGAYPCPNNPGNVTDLQNLQPTSTPPYTYEVSSEPLPPLPPEGELSNIDPATSCEIPVKVTNSVTLPLACAKDGVVYNTYHFSNKESFALGGGDVITVDAPGQTVVWYVEGSIRMTHKTAQIVVTPGTTLVIYAHDEIKLDGGSDVGGPFNNPGTPDNIQVYNYSTEEVSLTGGSGAKAFVFSPNGLVKLTGTAVTRGTIWAHAWHGTGTTSFLSNAIDLNCANLPASFCGGASTGNKIESITAWERVSR